MEHDPEIESLRLEVAVMRAELKGRSDLIDARVVEKLSVEVAVLREHLVGRANLVDARIDTARTSLQATLEASGESIKSQTHVAISDAAGAMMSKEDFANAHDALESKTNSQIRVLHDKYDILSRPSYMLWASSGAAILGLVSGLWTVNGLKIENSIEPLVVITEQLKTGQLSQDKQIDTIAKRVDDSRSIIDKNSVTISSGMTSRVLLEQKLAELDKEVTNHNLSDSEKLTEIRLRLERMGVILDLLPRNDSAGNLLPPSTPPRR